MKSLNWVLTAPAYYYYVISSLPVIFSFVFVCFFSPPKNKHVYSTKSLKTLTKLNVFSPLISKINGLDKNCEWHNSTVINKISYILHCERPGWCRANKQIVIWTTWRVFNRRYFCKIDRKKQPISPLAVIHPEFRSIHYVQNDKEKNKI